MFPCRHSDKWAKCRLQPTSDDKKVSRAMTEASDEERIEEAKPGGPKTIVVGIGASAGGVRALQHLFAALP
jgi:chemotaxis response regulator CheB